MKLYLAGPMTGHPDLNFPAFHEMAARLRGLGHEIINPAEINPNPGAAWTDCMRADIAQLVTCEGVVTLPGWERSRGARIEVMLAGELGMSVLDAARLVGDVVLRAPAEVLA
ncbi:Phage protein [plant metagenome]|uniref:Phage protein n=1 Tax=plant metagenome TaxID=1297885 RepID=A0A484VB99_9ZZZZ